MTERAIPRGPRFPRWEAEKQASKIREYWADRGYVPMVEVIEEKAPHLDTPCYWVRSDMVAGLPVRSRRVSQ